MLNEHSNIKAGFLSKFFIAMACCALLLLLPAVFSQTAYADLNGATEDTSKTMVTTVAETETAIIYPIAFSQGEILASWEIGADNASDVVATLYSDGTLALTGSGDVQAYTGSNRPPWYAGYSDRITSFTMEPTITPTSMAHWFYDCSYLKSFPEGLIIPDTVTSLNRAFYGCYSLVTFPEGFTIPDSVTDLAYAFYDCFSLIEFPKGFNFSSSATQLTRMFYGCSSLVSLPDGCVLPSVAENLGSIFYGCMSLASLPAGFTIPSSVTTMTNMFEGCSSLASLPDGFSLPETITDLSSVFSGCSSLVSLPKDFMLPKSVNNLTRTFSGCSSLSSLPEGFIFPDEVSNLTRVFQNCSSLTSLPEGLNIPSGVRFFTYAFDGCTSLVSLPEGFTFASSSADATNAFYDCISLASLPEGFTLPRNGNTKGIFGLSSSWGYTAENPLTITCSINDFETLYAAYDWEGSYRSLEITQVGTADIADLARLVKQVINLDPSLYTDAEWSTIQEAYAAAKIILADPFATQLEVNMATATLRAAIGIWFSDVNDPNEYYYEPVYYMVNLGLITGYNETTFGVGDPMSRAQLVTIMWRYCAPDEYANYNEQQAKDTTGLPDAQNGMYYTGAVNWAYENGIVTGNLHEDGTYTFNPDDAVTFEQLATIVARYALGGTEQAADYNTAALDDGAFTDKDAVEEFARGSMSWAIDNNVVTGNDNHDGTYTLAPLEDVARERGATVLARSIEGELI